MEGLVNILQKEFRKRSIILINCMYFRVDTPACPGDIYEFNVEKETEIGNIVEYILKKIGHYHSLSLSIETDKPTFLGYQYQLDKKLIYY